LLRGVQTAIARRLLSPNDVSMNWFSRDPNTGFQIVDTAELGPDGAFGEWPIDFDATLLAADWAYIDAVAGTNDGN
jgi:hypothetical protein